MNQQMPPMDDETLARELSAAMTQFADARSLRGLDGAAMLRSARRRTWAMATAAAAAVVLLSGGAVIATSAVRGSTRPPSGISSSPSPTLQPSPSTSASLGTPSSAPTTSAAPISDAESRQAGEVVAKVYAILATHLRIQTGSAAGYFVNHHTYTAAWGSGAPSSAPMACGSAFNGAIVGDPALDGTHVAATVELLKADASARKHAVVKLDRATMKIASISCKSGTPTRGSGGAKAARDVLAGLYGPYLSGGQVDLPSLLTPQFQAKPDPHDSVDQFNKLVCSQDAPVAWVAGPVEVTGKDAVAELTVDIQTVPVTVDVASGRIAFIDCVPFPPVSSATDAVSAGDFLKRFLEAYEVAWGWRAARPVRPLIQGYFASGVLDTAWTDKKGLLPAGCHSSAPYVDIVMAAASPQRSGSVVTYEVNLLDQNSSVVGTGHIRFDLNSQQITGLIC